MNGESPLTKAGPHRTAFGEKRVHGDAPGAVSTTAPFPSFAKSECVTSALGGELSPDDAFPQYVTHGGSFSQSTTILAGIPSFVDPLRQFSRRVRDRTRALVRVLCAPGSRSRGRSRQGGRAVRAGGSRRSTSGSASRDDPSEPSDPPPRSVDGRRTGRPRPAWWRAALGVLRHLRRPSWDEIDADAREDWEVPK